MKITTTPLGTQIESDTFIALLGNREAQLPALQSEFPSMKFKRIKQVHGHRSVHTSAHSIDFSNEADAHYTSERGLGLCIATADCAPVLIYHSKPQWVCSIHAGWRGVESRIVPKSVASLIRLGCSESDLQIFVGPHIQLDSFEVGNDVRDRLLGSIQGDVSSIWQTVSDNKSKVNLHEILKFQLMESGVPLENCHFEFKDTVSDLSYHSFRRDRENSGRQISFIALKV